MAKYFSFDKIAAWEEIELCKVKDIFNPEKIWLAVKVGKLGKLLIDKNSLKRTLYTCSPPLGEQLLKSQRGSQKWRSRKFLVVTKLRGSEGRHCSLNPLKLSIPPPMFPQASCFSYFLGYLPPLGNFPSRSPLPQLCRTSYVTRVVGCISQKFKTTTGFHNFILLQN